MSPNQSGEKSRLYRFGAFAAAIGIAGLVGIVIAFTKPTTSYSQWPTQFSAEGQRLYFTGRSQDGGRIVPHGGNHHMNMMGTGGCVSCHGTDRKGGRLWPAFWQVAPSITADDLVGDHTDDGHSHASYTSQTLAIAITEGIRPDGTALGRAMPRWSMSGADLKALTEFLLAH